MRNIFFIASRPQTAKLVAAFGEAKLVKLSDGRYELRGGRPEDHFEAREWASLFMHEALVEKRP
jgi:hypothetical protein